jgi:hypothetical protein
MYGAALAKIRKRTEQSELKMCTTKIPVNLGAINTMMRVGCI